MTLGTHVGFEGVERGFRRDLHVPRAVDVVLVDVRPRRVSGFDHGAYELAVIAKREPLPQHVIPDESARCVRERVVAFVGIAARESSEAFLQIVGHEAFVGPLVSVGAQHAVAVEIVEQDELLCEGVVVRRHVASKLAKAGIAVALWHITKDLVVRPVLLDDVHDMLEG